MITDLISDLHISITKIAEIQILKIV